ncbi:MAG: PQQ-dependent sugar dehydrogenase, partial [Bacteroidota bacterium]
FISRKGAKKEIFSYGHRNPQGMDLHPTTGKIWAHEHGPRGGDELNIVEKGNNYGWPTITYGINYSGTKITDETHREGMEQPVTYWVPSIAPCGMSFVTSDKYPAWKGNILIGSLAFRYLNRVELDGNKVVHQEKLLDNIGRVRAIEESPDGIIYVAIEAKGMIVRLLPL